MDAEVLPPTLDAETLDMLRRLSGDGIKQLFEVFHEEVRDRLARLTEAVANGDRDAVARITHSLRGISGTMGAMRLCQLSEWLEAAASSGETVSAAQAAELHAEYDRVCAALNALQ
jgi:two-component system, sensor histidine kinase and response regulator